MLMLVVGLTGIALGMPLIFPSLGPTAFLHAETPERPSARFYNSVVGHLIGTAAGFLAVFLAGATDSPIVLSSGVLTYPRMWASVLALALTALGTLIARASHPPAGATTLLIALGAFSTFSDAATLMTGVLIVSFSGEFFRVLRIMARERQHP